MPGWLQNFKMFLQDPNNQKFFVGLLALFLITYVLKGESKAEKGQRLAKILLWGLLIMFLYGLYKLFIKN